MEKKRSYEIVALLIKFVVNKSYSEKAADFECNVLKKYSL